MRIAIVGAGVSGLACYLWLRKLGLTEQHSICIYEAHPSSAAPDESAVKEPENYNASAIGGALGLSPNGLKVLRRLDDKLHNEVLMAGQECASWKLSTARGWTLAEVETETDGMKMVMISRDVFWRLLRRRVPEDVVVGKKVIEVRTDDARPRLVFSDREEESTDLVIGADGIWSTVRRAIFHAQGEQPYQYLPQYEGLVGVGGFTPSEKLVSVPKDRMHVVFGANGFFDYGYCASQPSPATNNCTATWWSTYSLKKCPADWRHIDREAARRDLQRRHASWKNKTIQNIVSDVEIGPVWPTFVTPLLPTWEQGGCVLIGDAAHALQPSSGQGASMALEDAEVLARLLAHHLEHDQESGHSLAAKQYSDMRIPRLKMVHKRAQQTAGMKQDMGVVMEIVMYLFIWITSKQCCIAGPVLQTDNQCPGRLRLTEKYIKSLVEYDIPSEVEKVTARQGC